MPDNLGYGYPNYYGNTEEKQVKHASYYTAEDLRDLLPIGRTQIYRLLKDGVIPSIALGRRRIVPRAAFERWLETCGAESTPQPAAGFNRMAKPAA